MCWFDRRECDNFKIETLWTQIKCDTRKHHNTPTSGILCGCDETGSEMFEIHCLENDLLLSIRAVAVQPTDWSSDDTLLSIILVVPLN